MKFAPLFIVPSIALLSTAYGQVYTNIDLSSLLTYDAVGTANEIAVQAPDGISSYTLAARLGNHNMNNSTAYTPEASLGSGGGMPLDGVLAGGKYTVSTAYDNGTDYLTKSNNMAQISGNNTVLTDTMTITLPLGQQANYDAFNMAFVVNRSSTISNAKYASQISVTYTDASTEVIMLTTATDDGSVQRGTFGSNNFSLATDGYTWINEAPDRGETVGITAAANFNRYLSVSGSGASQRSTIKTDGSVSIWEFSDDITLDSSKVLESISISVTRGGGSSSNRNNTLNIFSATLVTVPEPGTYALLAGAACLAALGLRRRRR